jgi:D-alanine-D-alanine ligase
MATCTGFNHPVYPSIPAVSTLMYNIQGNHMNHAPADLPVILLYNLDRSWPPSDIEEILGLVQNLTEGLSTVGHPTQVICLEDDRLEQVMAGCDPSRQIVFNWCEEVPGIPRSSALVACKLEELGFTFTGADSQALLFSQDKPAVKERLTKKKIPTPCWQVCQSVETVEWDCFPAIVKPAYEHYSFGITHEAVVHTRQDLLQRVAHVAETFNQPVLVEDFIDGREFHVSVVGNGRLKVFPIAEMDFSAIQEPSNKLCTYDSKFEPASLDYQLINVRLPALLTAEEKQQLEAVSIAAYRATNCRDYARLDIRQRDGIFYVLDVNPNADLSPDTSLALSAGLAGFSFAQFGSYLVELAARRYPHHSHLKKEKDHQTLSALAPAG